MVFLLPNFHFHDGVLASKVPFSWWCSCFQSSIFMMVFSLQSSLFMMVFLLQSSIFMMVFLLPKFHFHDGVLASKFHFHDCVLASKFPFHDGVLASKVPFSWWCSCFKVPFSWWCSCFQSSIFMMVFLLPKFHFHDGVLASKVPFSQWCSCLWCFTKATLMTVLLLLKGWDRSAQLTEKPDTVLMWVRVPGAARDFSPRVNFLWRLLYNVCVHSHASTSEHTLKIPNTGRALWSSFRHVKILHTLTGMGSVALVAAVLYPGKVTLIAHKGPWSTQKQNKWKQHCNDGDLASRVPASW